MLCQKWQNIMGHSWCFATWHNITGGIPTCYTSVICHFSLHAKLPFRGKMEWISIPFYPCRVELNGHAIPFCPFPVHNSPACYFPMQNMHHCVFVMGKYIAFYVVLITKLVTIPTVVVVIVVIQITCNCNCSCIF